MTARYIAFYALASALSVGGPNARAENVSIDMVTRSWFARQERASSVDFSWRAHKFHSGAYSSVPSALRSKNDPPQPDTTYETLSRVIFDNDGRIRFEDEDVAWIPEKARYSPKKCIDAFDKVSYVSFFPFGRQPFPSGHIQPETAAEIGRHYKLIAISLCFRPFDKHFGMLAPEALSLSTEIARVKGERALVLTYQGGDARDSVWVDPSKEYVPVHYVKRANGRDRWVVDISYSHDVNQGWVPESWKITFFDKTRGCVLMSESAKVTQYSLSTPVPASMFTVQLPVGTFVNDYVKNEQYIIQAENKHRTVLPGEFTGDNYEQLLVTEPRERGWTGTWSQWLAAANIAIVVALLGVLLYRRARKAAP